MGSRVWKGEPSAGGRAGTIIALVLAALMVAGVWFGWTRYQGHSPVSNLSQTFSISFSEDARAIVSKEEESFHGDGYRYVKVTADPEKVDGTVLDGRDYSNERLSQESIRIIKENERQEDSWECHLKMTATAEGPHSRSRYQEYDLA